MVEESWLCRIDVAIDLSFGEAIHGGAHNAAGCTVSTNTCARGHWLVMSRVPHAASSPSPTDPLHLLLLMNDARSAVGH